MASNFVNASYQEIIDLHTEASTVSVIGVHTPCTDTPVKMLAGFWDQFRKVKYNGCSISLVPAAQLPADPLQVSYEAGAATIDPRDMLNPILFHGCHGEDMGAILNMLYSGDRTTSDIVRKASDSTEQSVFSQTQVGNDYVDALYYKALTDTTWAKAHPQRGFRRSGLRPLVHRVVANASFANFAEVDSVTAPRDQYASGPTAGNGELGPGLSDVSANLRVTGLPGLVDTSEDTEVYLSQPRTVSGLNFMTSRMEPMGWIDTHAVVQYDSERQSSTLSGAAPSDANAIGNFWAQSNASGNALQSIPKAFMGMIMLPPAYKTEQYFRLVINHNFSFKNFRGLSMNNDRVDVINYAPSVYNFN